MKQKEKIKRVELIINKHLYYICAIITVLTMLMFLIDFFSRGFYSIEKIELFYLGILVIYSLHKEIIRYIGSSKLNKQGEFFVYAWVSLTMFLYLVNFFSQNYFALTINKEPSLVLKNVSLLTLEILGIFILTRGLKFLKIYLSKEK